MKRIIIFLLLIISCVLSFPVSVMANTANDAIIITKNTDMADMKLIVNFVRSNGGSVSLVFGPSAFIGEVPSELEQLLLDKYADKIDLYRSKVNSAYGDNDTVLPAINFWNSKFEPELGTVNFQSQTAPAPIINDAKIPLDKSKDLQSQSDIKKFSAPTSSQTSEYMYGDVMVSVVLLESNSAVDANIEDWTAQEETNVDNEIAYALDWWVARKPANVNLTFWLFSVDGRNHYKAPTKYEPINRPQYNQDLWINDAMNYLGVQSDYYFSRVRAYDDSIRNSYNTNWAFTIFVVDSSADADGEFTNHYSAYAYLTGPFLVLTYDNGNYGVNNMDYVTVHGMGHIFGAGDQYVRYYYDPPVICSCTAKFGFLQVENQNCENNCLSNVPSIMRNFFGYVNNPSAIDYYARGQVGWRDLDTDGIVDIIDSTYNSDTDTDIDGIVNYWDANDDNDNFIDIDDGCPLQFGPACNNGCPDTDVPVITVNSPFPTRYPYKNILISLSVTDNVVNGVNSLLDKFRPKSEAPEVLAQSSTGCLDTIWMNNGTTNIVLNTSYAAPHSFDAGQHTVSFYANDSYGNLKNVNVSFSINLSRLEIASSKNTSTHNCNNFDSVSKIDGFVINNTLYRNINYSAQISWTGWHYYDPNHWAFFLNDSLIDTCITYEPDYDINNSYAMACELTLPANTSLGNYSLVLTANDVPGYCTPSENGTDAQQSINIYIDCFDNWVLNNTWSACDTNNYQYKNYYESNNCNKNSAPTSINQTCDFCTPNWTEVLTACQADDSKIGWFKDTADCFAKTNLTSDLEGTPENKTHSFYCDSNSDGFIGNSSNINTTLVITITTTNDTIEFKDANASLIKFDFNLTQNQINLANIIIEKQNINDSFGYLLVKGIDLTPQNKTKTIIFDKKINATGICIKDAEISAMSELSEDCTSASEAWLACPGFKDNYACNLTNNNNSYEVFGLQHSGLKELATFCGDAVCNGAEACSSCSKDCGSCSSSGEGSGGGGGGGGGGSGGGGGGGAQASTFFDVVVAGQTLSLDINKGVAITNLEVEAKAAAIAVKFTVEMDFKPSYIPEPSNTIYKYAEIRAENLPESAIGIATIRFDVDKKWLAENSIDANTIIMQRYTGSWQEIPTTKLSESADKVMYSARSPGFSYFAITGKKSEKSTLAEQTLEKTEQTGAENEITGAAVGVGAKGGRSNIWKVALLTLFVIALIVRPSRKFIINKLVKDPFRRIFSSKRKQSVAQTTTPQIKSESTQTAEPQMPIVPQEQKREQPPETAQ